MKALLFVFLLALALAVPLFMSVVPSGNADSPTSITDYPLYRMKDFLVQHKVALASIDESGPVALPLDKNPNEKVLLYPETLKSLQEECAKRHIALKGA